MKKFDEINWTDVKEGTVKVLRGSWSIAVIVLAIGFGWYGRGLFDKATESSVIVAQTIKHPTRTIDKTSVAVNERDELIIFDRETGDYAVYAKEVRMAIFNQQFTKIQMDFKSKN